MPKAAAPADKSPPTTAQKPAGAFAQPKGRNFMATPLGRMTAPVMATVAVLASTAGLAIGITPRLTGVALSQDLATLSATWQVPKAKAIPDLAQHRSHQHQAQKSSAAPEVGDEGFWLSRHDLAGQAAGLVAVGDRISISAPRFKVADIAAPTTRIFEVIELKPLAAPITPISSHARDKSTSLNEPEGNLTIVVCREQTSDTTATPRVIRFLMETSPAAPASGPPLPRSL